MPDAPLRPCGVCRQPCPGGDCPRHPKRGGYRPDRRSIRTKTYQRNWAGMRNAALVLADGKCQYCGKPARTGDHVLPASRGGPNLISNIVAACARCNTSKGDRTLREWIESGCAPAGAAKLLRERVAAGLPV